ncbi:biotin--[acetyl-CoA-carboxylase] ligase [uncultured Polaribacter sp.]|uniref:biotin--[acetyl-CoA-carboxylase] ligase n=1 Tax=uncultured Polaribacter sp. TaxID=174711 RepID=UPI0026213426|nr:biotin--[acetyl-CoA-carboxylase] ligase [uncultured Polaribacter sp.]
MKIIKLNAIDSTNSFLKEMALDSALENFTVVVTNTQLKGRGQQGSKWVSDSFKNLMFSVFIKFEDLKITQQRYLNFAISLAIFDALIEEKIPNIAIKWPNDIMSGNKKIAGILVENNLKGAKINTTIIGIGLNVNQTAFPDALKKVSSLKIENGRDFNLEVLLKNIISKLKMNIETLNSKEFKTLETDYLKVLYKKNIPTMFKNSKDVLFMGIIRGISNDGKLQVELEDEILQEFGIKEISFL